MYAGHLGVALAARGLGERAPLAWLILATQGPDWIAIVLGAAGIADRTEVWSHSIPAVGAGAALCVALCWLATRRPRAALLTGAVYLTHPILDLVTGLKPTWAGGPMLGLCVYDRPAADFVVEGALVLAGVALYRRVACAPHDRLVPRLMLVILLGCQLGADALQAWRLHRFSASETRAPFLQCPGGPTSLARDARHPRMRTVASGRHPVRAAQHPA